MRSKSPKSIKSVTLIELIISVIIVAIIILSFFAMQMFSQNQAVNSDRRVKVQNDLAYALEHMSKYIQMGSGNNVVAANHAIMVIPNGFQVRVDFQPTQTPAILSNTWVSYSLSGTPLALTASCAGSGCPFTTETLSKRIIPSGFNVTVDPSGNSVEIDLVGRYDPSKSSGQDPVTRLTNPQVEMITKILCNSASTN